MSVVNFNPSVMNEILSLREQSRSSTSCNDPPLDVEQVIDIASQWVRHPGEMLGDLQTSFSKVLACIDIDGKPCRLLPGQTFSEFAELVNRAFRYQIAALGLALRMDPAIPVLPFTLFSLNSVLLMNRWDIDNVPEAVRQWQDDLCRLEAWGCSRTALPKSHGGSSEWSEPKLPKVWKRMFKWSDSTWRRRKSEFPEDFQSSPGSRACRIRLSLVSEWDANVSRE
jgi:hypothetical protein